jgi:phytanoyl-CoA hydroxylase
MAPVATNPEESSSKATNLESLSPAQLAKFRSDGYLVLADFFDPAAILDHSRSLIQNFDPTQHPLTKFTTGDDAKQDDAHVGDRYFLESGDKIRYFLEQDSINPSTGKLNRSPELCVNKCGHALHALDQVFHQLSFSSKVQNLVRSLENFRLPQVLQSMIICKQPSIGGAVPSHNDSTFLYTSPPSATGLWFALEDCSLSNGCLSFLPGSHRWSKNGSAPAETDASKRLRPGNEADAVSDQYGAPRGVNKRFVRSQPGNVDSGTSFELLHENEEDQWDESRAVVEECKAGESITFLGPE